MKIEVPRKLIKKLGGLEEYSDFNKEELLEAVTDLVEELLEEYLSASSSAEDVGLVSDNERQDEERNE